jgi:glycosyltransferase involved in cell wall biosynthesis
VLLFLGRITADKGVRELLAAFNSLKATDNTAHLVFVGRFDSDSGVSGAISQAEISCLPDTHLVDYSSRPEAYLAIADLLCLPSYREGFGTVVIDAAAMGVPTLGTAIYGLSDAVVEGETGVLVPPANSLALTAALEKLLAHPARLKEMGEAARLRAVTLFNAEWVNGKVAEEYARLLENVRGRGDAG